MKNILIKSITIASVLTVLIQANYAFAQEIIDYGSYTSPSYGVVDYGSYTSPSYGVTNYGSYTSPTYGVTNYGSYTSPTVSTVNYGSYTSPTVGVTNYGSYTSPTYSTTNYGSYTSPTVSTVDYGSYTSPTVGVTNYGSYTSPTYGTTNYGNTSTYSPVDYGYSNYGATNYGATNYGYTNYGATNYGYTNYGQTGGSSWTGVNSCLQGQQLINGTCQYIYCSSGTTLINGTCQTTTTATVYNTAWCQSIGWDYVTNTTLGYCACNAGRTYSGDANTGRGGTCQPTTTSCTADAKVCPDGSTVGRVAPGCDFAVCPVITTCPSGTYPLNGSCTPCPTGVAVSPGPAGCPAPNPTCPTGTTLINGVCQINTTVCPTGSTLINGVCQVNQTVCPTGSTLINGTCQINGTTCPAGSTLINGICQINSTACPTGSTLINGVCQINQTVCPTGSTLVNNVCQINNTVCPSGSTLINGVCQAPITCPTGTSYQNGVCLGYGTTVCPSGSNLINGVCQINQTTCPSGSVFINGVCQAPITCPSGTSYQNGSCVNNQVMVTCPNGSVVNYLFQCPVTYGQTSYAQTSYGYTNYNIPQVIYQTCWDGTVLPNTSVCPSQYKMCANGTSIPINQTCYVAPVPVYVPPVVVKFNNVVTSVVTQITNTSARCNGIGIIAQGAQSTGWFEYGQTANLGRTTSPAIIGSSATSPFSNVLSNLQPSTAYYCRAVMQNQYGIVKGEIVKFTTKAKVATYVQPTPVKTSVKNTVKKVVKKNEIICSDGSVVSAVNESSATILNQGQKLIAVQMEKITGELTVGGNVSYRLSYKNLVGTNLTGVIIKIVVPEEISLTDVPMGSYDEATHTMTFNQLSVGPYSENVINWSGTVKKTAPLGKTIVTTAYVLYTVPGTQVQDEVTAYTASSITAGPDIQTLSGSKHVIGAGVGSFLPSSLVEWLALIAILFIIFILGRSIAASYKKGDEAHH